MSRGCPDHVPDRGDVVLVTGPAGSGKSTLVRQLGRQLGWESVSEDSYWVENGWGSGLRTPEQESVIQRQVLEHLLTACRAGRRVVLEFILYAEPPNPLTAYRHTLGEYSVSCSVIVLTASVPELMRRLAARGRPGDLQQMADRRCQAEYQLRVLASVAMRSYPVLDTTDLSVGKVYQASLKRLSRPPG